nr:histidine kinase [Kibdelosporangium sp. MJ126-NF4]CEL21528.1 putative two component system sensor kinase [Kibdelosporangium sp. MJ126-NF4]CTQ95905.1 putative two component system sensor kinase [Kibdelosporangium sp. MJ126-NF4]
MNAPRFVDGLIRPFAMVTVAAVGVVQFASHPQVGVVWLTWGLMAVTIASGLGISILPWHRLTDRVQVTLVAVYVVSSALLFPLAVGTVAVALVFIAVATAGEKLAGRQLAFVMAGVAIAVAVLATWAAVALLHLPDVPWWLPLTVCLPVYAGIARRSRADAVAAAEQAAAQARRAAASEAREAALEERGRIAREIHDVLGHALSGIAMQLEMADALHGGGRDDDANEAVRRARAMAVSGIGETRRAIHALREDTLPLPQTLANLATSATAGFTVHGEPGEIQVEAAQAIIRTAQEAITNAHRHAPGAEVTLVLDYTDQAVRLIVTDTGAADMSTAVMSSAGSGMGLVGMRERASLLGGTLYAGPAESGGHGWLVRLELPR